MKPLKKLKKAAIWLLLSPLIALAIAIIIAVAIVVIIGYILYQPIKMAKYLWARRTLGPLHNKVLVVYSSKGNRWPAFIKRQQQNEKVILADVDNLAVFLDVKDILGIFGISTKQLGQIRNGDACIVVVCGPRPPWTAKHRVVGRDATFFRMLNA